MLTDSIGAESPLAPYGRQLCRLLPDCCSAQQFDADLHAEVLILLDCEGSEPDAQQQANDAAEV